MPDELTTLRAELAHVKAQLERSNEAWKALRVLATGYQEKIRADTTSIESLNSTVGSMAAENKFQWASLVNAELKIQDIDQHVIGMLRVVHPFVDAMMGTAMQMARGDALITLQLPDENIRTPDGGDEPRKHTAILVGGGVLQVYQFRELARFMQLLKHGHPELE